MIAFSWYENSFNKIKLSESSLTVDFMANLQSIRLIPDRLSDDGRNFEFISSLVFMGVGQGEENSLGKCPHPSVGQCDTVQNDGAIELTTLLVPVG